MAEKMLTIAELAEMLQVTPATIYGWRYRGFGPASYKIGRHVRYRLADVEEWLTTVRTEADPYKEWFKGWKT